MSTRRSSGSDLPAIITASSVGTLIEWYDFFIFGSLATVISKEFFPQDNPAASFLATLATFSAGLIIRPLGALIFGRLGDRMGRKHTFMITLGIMGISTMGIGFVPGYSSIGFLAPLSVLILRLLQGLALGGEYGGAAIYIAEHAPERRRGFFTSWIQTTSGLAFILSIFVILLVRSMMPENIWLRWGWRVPFIASVLLVGISFYIRSKMSESPLFAKIKSEGRISKNPIRESFGRKSNLRTILLAFLGLTLGAGAIGWITFYAQNFLLKTAGLDYDQANAVIIIGILLGMPFFLFFGWLSDRIGRRNLLIAGMFLGAVMFRPTFDHLYTPVSVAHAETNPVSVTKDHLIEMNDTNHPVRTTTTRMTFASNTVKTEIIKEVFSSGKYHQIEHNTTVKLSDTGKWKLIFWIFVLQFIFTMAYGPLGAFMVEMFPVKIRYTSVSFPYHFGFGIFGGLAPYFATYLVQKAGEAGDSQFFLAGLQYPVLLTLVSVIIGLLYIPDDAPKVWRHPLSFRLVNSIRRGLGIVWMVLSLTVCWFGIAEFGVPKINSGMQEDLVFGIILVFLITPISSIGLFLFGWYAMKGAYDVDR